MPALPEQGEAGVKRVKRAIKEPSKYTPVVDVQKKKMVCDELKEKCFVLTGDQGKGLGESSTK